MNYSVICLLALLAVTVHSQANIPGCDGARNPFDIVKDAPHLVQSVPNGQKYTIPYDGRFMYVLNLTGTAYQMGLAYGTLMKKEVKIMIPQFYKWLDYYITHNVTQIAALPQFVRWGVGKLGVSLAKVLLRLNYKITKKYTPARWNEEYKGLSDGSGLSVNTFREMNMFPELLKASCSILGAWGDSTLSGNVIHLRTLDWEEHAPMSRFPVVAVYHSTEPGSVPFTNLAWAGFIGSLTGFSTHIGFGERLRGGPANTMTYFGKPWTYVIRDTLQFSKTIDDAIYSLQTAARTCSVYLGVGSKVNNTFRIVQYSHTELDVFDDNNWHFDSNHPQTKDMMWKEYRAGTSCFKNFLLPNYGKIEPEMIVRDLVAFGQTGDSQVAVMDYANYHVYLMYPNPDTLTVAYFRPAVFVDLNPFFGTVNGTLPNIK